MTQSNSLPKKPKGKQVESSNQGQNASNNDLFELFGSDFSFDEPLEKETIMFPLAEENIINEAATELSELFGDDFSFEEEKTIIQTTPFFVEKGTDLASKKNLGANQEIGNLSFVTDDGQAFTNFLENEFSLALAEEEEREQKQRHDHTADQSSPMRGPRDEFNEFLEEDFLLEYENEEGESPQETGGEGNEIDELSDLLESSLNFTAKEKLPAKSTEELQDVSDFLEENFLSEYGFNEQDQSGESSSLDELSELLEESLVHGKKEKVSEPKVEVDQFFEKELMAGYEPKTEFNSAIARSELDELSQLLDHSGSPARTSAPSSPRNSRDKKEIKVMPKQEDTDDFSNFLEEQFLAQHEMDSDSPPDEELSNIEELSQLLENSLSFGVSSKPVEQESKAQETPSMLHNFLEDEFLAEYVDQDLLEEEENSDSVMAELDELSQMLDSSLSSGGAISENLNDTDPLSQLLEGSLSSNGEISGNLNDGDELSQLLMTEKSAQSAKEEEESLVREEVKPAIKATQEEMPIYLRELYEDLSELEWVLEQPPILEPLELNGEVKHLEELINSVITIPLDLYDPVSELEILITEPANFLTYQIDVGGLMAIINAPVSSTVKPLGMVTPLSEVRENPSKTTLPSTVQAIAFAKTTQPPKDDDEFGDLEQLLEQADLSMGGSKTTAAPRQAPQPKKANLFEQTMKVSVKQLDTLNNLMGELVVNRNSLEQDQERLRQFLDSLLNQVQNLSDVGGRMQDLYERSLLESSLLAARQGVRHGSTSYGFGGGGNQDNSNDQDYDPLEMDRFTGFHLLSAEMLELIVRVRESASDIQFLVDETDQVARNLRQVSTQMSEGLTKTRMLPFSHTAERFSSGLFRIKRKLKKEAKLVIEGRDVLIDKMIQEHLQDPMIHLINNAMTHGIESPEERKKLGKDIEGTITVRAFVQGNQTVITVSDDGAGINPAKVKAKAIERKLISPQEAAKLSKPEIYDFLFNAGFSTADQVGDLAGRGVGLDVVRTHLNDIRGNVTVDSKIGQGTTFTIRLPLTLSISKALCCLSDHARIAFPMDGVEDMQDYLPHEIQTDEQGQKFVLWRDSYLPFQPLSDFLSYNRHISRGSVYGKQASETVSIVILRSAGKLLGVQVDQVLGEQEIVIKQIQGPIPKPPGIAGATVLGDGRIMPIADVLELIDISEGNLRKEAGSQFLKTHQNIVIEEAKSQPIVLIVDDSITVRELLSMSFNKAGYQVEQAKNGLEAWEKLISGLPCDIIFCDVEMPQMDGLELLSNINNDEKLKEIPVAMLTSRGAEKHRKIAAELGASGYFTKPYLEEVLLDGAQKMMDGEVLLAHSIRQPRPKPKPQPKTEVVEPLKTPEPQFVVHHPTVLQSSIKEKPKVLIIDDSVTVRELLSMTFKNAGYMVEQAKDGEDAWQKLNDNPDIDLAFCDIEMPRLNGLDLLARLQKDERLSKLPVAMLTSRGAQKMKNIAAERGARGYFVKPYMEEVLLDAAEKLYKGEVLLTTEEENSGE